MPAVSQAQRGLIFGKRSKYGSEHATPKKWKWVWHEGWENKGRLAKKKRKKKSKKESFIFKFETFVNENYKNEKRVNDMSTEELENENNMYIKIQNSHRLTPHDERRWKKISNKLNKKD